MSAPSKSAPIIKSEGEDNKGARQQQQRRRRNPYRGRQSNSNNTYSRASTNKFIGKSEGLEDVTFDVGLPNNGELFTKHIELLAEYAGREHKNAHDISSAILNITEREFDIKTIKKNTEGDKEIIDFMLNKEDVLELKKS